MARLELVPVRTCHGSPVGRQQKERLTATGCDGENNSHRDGGSGNNDNQRDQCRHRRRNAMSEWHDARTATTATGLGGADAAVQSPEPTGSDERHAWHD